jgi:ABC-2 type transport system ATP-binding protein
VIEVESLSKFYGSTEAVHDVSFSLEKGEVVGLVGRNGAGKSTLMNIMAGCLAPTSGTVRVGRHDVVEQPYAARAHLGFLPEYTPLYEDLTVEAFLRYLGQLRGLAGAKLDERVRRSLASTDIADRADDVIGTLSLGYRKRVGIAQAIIHAPELVILDEPISGLDPFQIKAMRELISELRDEHAVLLSSHILSEVEESCDRFLIIHQGRLVSRSERADADVARLDISLRGDIEQALSILRSHEGVRKVEDIEPSQDGTTLAVTFTGDIGARLNKILVEAGFEIVRLQPFRSSLEAEFISLTQSEEVVQ